MPGTLDTDRSIAIVQAHQAEIWRYLRFLGCTAVEAEDLAQETFLAVLRRPFEDRGPIRTAAYLRRVARNLLLKSRRARPHPVASELDRVEQAWRAWCGRDGGDRYLEALRACLQDLEGRARRALHMRYAENQSRGQIGAELGMAAEGVKALLRRVRQSLRGCVERRIDT